MKQFFLEIFLMFRKEKLYLFLLMALLAFYGVVLAGNHVFVKKEKQEPSNKIIETQGQSRVKTQKEVKKEDLLDSKMISKKLEENPELWKPIRILALTTFGIFLAGISLNFFAMHRFVKQRELVSRAGDVLHISWGSSEIVQVILLFICFGVVLNLTVSLFKLIFGSPADSFGFILLHTLSIDLLLVFFIVNRVRKSGARVKDLLGFTWRKIPLREISVGFLTYLAILPAVLGLLMVLVYLSNKFSYQPPPHPLVNLFMSEEANSPIIMGLSLVLACLVGPIVEEIFFRGFLYPAIRKYGGTGCPCATLKRNLILDESAKTVLISDKYPHRYLNGNQCWAMVVSAGLFAALHENIFSFLPIFLLGLALCYLYEKRSSVLACISLHVVHNSLFVGYFFLVKNLLT